MSGFRSGLDLAILSLVLLFSWLAVAVYASAELAFAVGMGVIAIWFLFFVPSGMINELIWQARQKKIMQHAMSQTPAYQPGTALPPPQSGTSLSVIDSPSGGAIDIYRDDLPRLLPELEPRMHATSFKRSLVLPILGTLMMIGASNDTFMQKLLEARGIMQKLPIEWAELKLPEQYQNKRAEFEQAARLAIRREACGRIMSGTIAPLVQFRPAADQARQIEAGDYVYEFTCKPQIQNGTPYLIWVAPNDLGRGSFTALMSSFTRHPTSAALIAACEATGNELLKPMQAMLVPVGASDKQPDVQPGRQPYADYSRVYGLYQLLRTNGAGGELNMSCWVNAERQAAVRFSRVAAP